VDDVSAGDVALNALLVAVVIRQIRGKRLTAVGLLWPIVLVGIAAAKYLKAVPSSGNDLELVLGGAGVGAALGASCGLLTSVERRPGDVIFARATSWAAILWVLGTGARMAFALYAENGGAAAIGHFSAANRITGAAAWTACLVLMALAEVVGRTALLAVRARTIRSCRASP
jgi:hypothetical protein